MIITTLESQRDILISIVQLHNNGQNFHADLTYSSGAFWKGLIKPLIRMDIEHTPDLTMVGDVRHLPVRSECLQSVVFDPPFIHAPGVDSIMGARFGGYNSQRELHRLYLAASEEITRVLAPEGLLVWKCQDIVESGKQVWNHVLIYNQLCPSNFVAEDLFILVRKNRLVGHNHFNQYHARKTHSYFWVFRKCI
jgi:hypothetical protein